MSLPATDEPHICATCLKSRVAKLPGIESIFACHRKREVKEGFCCEWLSKGGK